MVALLYMARFDASFLSLRAKQCMDKVGASAVRLSGCMDGCYTGSRLHFGLCQGC